VRDHGSFLFWEFCSGGGIKVIFCHPFFVIYFLLTKAAEAEKGMRRKKDVKILHWRLVKNAQVMRLLRTFGVIGSVKRFS
jgi:hypothetical protein